MYPGKLDLRHFENTSYDFSQIQKLNDYTSSNATIELTDTRVIYTYVLHRQITFHLFSTYFPTMLMHGIGYGTLFIRADDFQDRGAFSLTTLLVLISLYSDTMVTLPVTSYLKHIDIWFIFSFTFLSFIIGIHIATNNTGINYDRNPKTAWLQKNKVEKILKNAQKIYGIGYVAFFAAYWFSFLYSDGYNPLPVKN